MFIAGPEQRDLITIYRRYAREAGLRIADRFLAAAEKSFRLPASMPGMGTHYEHDHPALAELRVSNLSSRFKVYLVFYRSVADGIEIVRVLHDIRDICDFLSDAFGIEEDAGDDEEGNVGFRTSEFGFDSDL